MSDKGVVVYGFGSTATFIYLTLLDGYAYTWWNWPIALAVNAFLSSIWPLYWLVIRWIPELF